MPVTGAATTRRYHPLRVEALERDTPDSLRLRLTVPRALADTFEFRPGQHLPLQVVVDGQPLRRTYSICSTPGAAAIELGIRVQPEGRVSNHLAERLAIGDEVLAMPPVGRFRLGDPPPAPRTLLAFAAGSGITPLRSIVAAALAREPETRVLLCYGNRTLQSTMFIDDLFALKNRYPERLQLCFVFSREEQAIPLLAGRLDRTKSAELLRAFHRPAAADEAFVCGPDTMIEAVSAALIDAGLPAAQLHAERFGAQRQPTPGAPRQVRGDSVAVTVIRDGRRLRFEMHDASDSLVDAAAAAGIDLPYSCKGGVCATCRTHLRQGSVRMDANFALEPWETEAGFILACQSHPTTDSVTLDYDRT